MTSSACFYGIAFVCYFLAGVMYIGAMVNKAPNWTPAARIFARVGCASHSFAMILYGIAVHHAPFTDVWESLSFFAWTLIFLYLIIDWRTPLPGLGAFVIPLGFLAIFTATIWSRDNPPPLTVQQNHALKFHIAVSLIGYGFFALSFCVALGYLIQERRLKRKELDGFFTRILPLDQADLLANRLAGIGFALLTLGLLMGLNFAAQDWTGRWWLDPKVLSSFLTWLLYGVYLYKRSVEGWRGRRTMLLLVYGFATVLLGFVGINMSGFGQHAYPMLQ